MLRASAKVAGVAVGAPATAVSALWLHEWLHQHRFAISKSSPSDVYYGSAVVLGGGIVGVASAYFLSRAGFDVTVLERARGAGQGTSAASGCLLSQKSCNVLASPTFLRRVAAAIVRGDPWLVVSPGMLFDFEFWRWGMRFFFTCFSPHAREVSEGFLRQHSPYFVNLVREIAAEEKFTGKYCAAQDGVLTVYSNLCTFQAASASARRSGSLVLSPQEAFEREPFLRFSSATVAGAIFSAADEHGDCGHFTELLASACKGRGVSFMYNAEVSSLRVDSADGRESRVAAAVLADGREVQGGIFVVAMGSQSPRLLRPIGIDLPIYPVKGYSYEMQFDPSSHGLKAPTVFAERQLGVIPLGGRLRFSSVAELAGWNEWEATPDVAARFQGDVESLFPDVAGHGAWQDARLIVGGRPTTPDDLPIVSRTRLPNLLVNAGHCMRGWRTACGTSAVVAAIASGNEPPNGIDVTRLSLDRFRLVWRG